MADIKKILTTLIDKFGDQPVADAIGVTVRSLYNYKSGESQPREKTQKKIDEIFRQFQEGSRELVVSEPQAQYKPNSGSIPDYRDEVIGLLKEQNAALKYRLNSELRVLKENQIEILAWVQTNAKYLGRIVAKQEKKSHDDVMIEIRKNGAELFEKTLQKDKTFEDGGS